MFSLKILALFTCAIINNSEAKFVDTLSKCSIKDSDCQGALISKSLKAIKSTGIPELGIPPIDPIEFSDIKISILELVELVATEGKAYGVSNCEVDNFMTDIDRRYTRMKLICSGLDIRTKYTLKGSTPLVKTLFGGGPIHGEGNAKVNIDSIEILFHYYYDIGRTKDGEPFFDCKFNTTQYEYKTLGKVTFAADNIFFDRMEMSDVAIGLLNANSKFIMDTFGKPFVDKAMELAYLYTHKFFDVVPAKYYIIEDLSQYVKS